VIGRTAHCPV